MMQTRIKKTINDLHAFRYCINKVPHTSRVYWTKVIEYCFTVYVVAISRVFNYTAFVVLFFLENKIEKQNRHCKDNNKERFQVLGNVYRNLKTKKKEYF